MSSKQLTKNDVAEIVAAAMNKQSAWIKVEFARVRAERKQDKEEILGKIDILDKRVTTQIATLSSDVADTFDLINLENDKQFAKYKKRLVRLEASNSKL